MLIKLAPTLTILAFRFEINGYRNENYNKLYFFIKDGKKT